MSCECCAPPPLRKPDPSECMDGCPAYPEGCETCKERTMHKDDTWYVRCDHCGKVVHVDGAYYLVAPVPGADIVRRFCSEECLKDWLSAQKRKSAAST